jgi:hypothetical protein
VQLFECGSQSTSALTKSPPKLGNGSKGGPGTWPQLEPIRGQASRDENNCGPNKWYKRHHHHGNHSPGIAQLWRLVSSQVEKSLDGLGRLIFTFLRATLRIHGCSPKKPPANILRTGDQNLTSPSSLQARTFPVSTGRNVRHVMVLPFASL